MAKYAEILATLNSDMRDGRSENEAVRRAISAIKSKRPIPESLSGVVDKIDTEGYSTGDSDNLKSGLQEAADQEVHQGGPGAPGGYRRRGKKTKKVRKTRKQVRKVRRTTRKLRGRGLFDMFSSKPKKLDAGLAGGVVPAGEIVSSIESVADKDPAEISVSSILAYERGLKLLEAIAATNMSKYKKAYTLVQELSVNGGKVTLADETGEMHTAGVFDRDDIQQAASELKTALSSYKPETGEVV